MPDSSAVAVRPEEPRAITLITSALNDRLDYFRSVLPASMDASRFVKVAVTAISKNPDLLRCTPMSIALAIGEAAEIGLEPTGSLNRAWLVPYGDQATLIIGYEGLQDLARDSGKITAIWSRNVYEGDEFEEVEGSERRLVHKPHHKTEDPEKILFSYAVAQYLDGTLVWEVMSKAQVDAIRAGSRGKNSKGWVQSYGQMARKCPVRRLCHSLPLTPRAIRAIQLDDEHEFGPAAPSEPKVTKASAVRERIAARNPRKRPTPAKSGPSATKAPTDADTGSAAPMASAEPQTDIGVAICGDESDPALGDVERCILPPDHLETAPDKKFHEGAGGGKWPAAKS